MLDVVVNVAVNDPGARVVKRCSEDDIPICWNLYGVFENGVVKVAVQTHTSVGAVFVHLDNEFSGDVSVKLPLSDHVVPASMLVNRMSYFGVGVGVDKDYFKPFFGRIWLLKDMTARCRLQWI